MERFLKPGSFLSNRLLAAMLLGCMVLLQCSEEDVRTPVMAEALPSALVSDWIDLQLILAKESPGFTAPIVARALGYSGLTFYESVVAGTIRNKSLVGQLTQIDFLPAPLPNTEYHWGLSANAAAAEISRKIFENAPAPRLTKIDSLENSYRKFWGEVSAAVSDRSIEFGKKVADSIYSYSKTDGGHKAFNRNFPATYTPPAGPGLWQPTNSQLALLPYWGANRTFIKGLNARVTTTGFPAYSTNPSSAFFAEAQQVYTTGKNLTPTQTTIAYYWADEGFVTYTPAGHSFAILSQLFRKEAFNLAAAALASVKLGMAMSDAFVYCWDVKYAKNLLRPSQFIQANIDALWVPLIPNPPFPEYTSGHSTQAAAASRVLASIFGENYSFTDFTHNKLGLGLAPRTFGTFYQMAEEAGQSRIYAGIHFSSGNLQGRASGYMIADEVLKLSFTK